LTSDEVTPDSKELEPQASDEIEADEGLVGEEIDPRPEDEGLAAAYMEYSHSGPLPGVPWFETIERLASRLGRENHR
jgi:hypothetical protein